VGKTIPDARSFDPIRIITPTIHKTRSIDKTALAERFLRDSGTMTGELLRATFLLHPEKKGDVQLPGLEAAQVHQHGARLPVAGGTFPSLQLFAS